MAIKFWDSLTRKSLINDNDKLLVGNNSTGGVNYTNFIDLLSYFQVSGGGIELRFALNNNPTIAPALSKDERDPAGWDLEPPIPTAEGYTWITFASLASNDELVDEWKNPIRLSGKDGENGSPGPVGSKPEVRYAINTSFTSPPPVNKTSREPNGWTIENPPVTPGNYLWEIRATINVDNTLIGEWTNPIRSTGLPGEDGEDGEDGDNGLNAATVYLYNRTETGDKPSRPTNNITYTFETGETTAANNGWERTLPETGGSFRWIIQATAVGGGEIDTIPPSEWSDPREFARDGKDGEDGKDGIDGEDGNPGAMGPSIAYRGDWSPTEEYRGTDKLVELVIFPTGGTNGYLTRTDAGNVPIGTEPTNSDYWNGPIPNSDALFADFIIAYSAYIANLTVGGIQTAYDGERTTIGFQPSDANDPTRNWTRHGERKYYPNGNIMKYDGYVPSFDRGDRVIEDQWAIIVWKPNGDLHFTLDSDSEGGVEYVGGEKRWYFVGSAREEVDLENDPNPGDIFFDPNGFEQAESQLRPSIFCGTFDYSDKHLSGTLGVKTNVSDIYRLEENGQPTKYVRGLNSENGLNGYFLANTFIAGVPIEVTNVKVFDEYSTATVTLHFAKLEDGIVKPQEKIVVEEDLVGFTSTIFNNMGACSANTFYVYYSGNKD